MMDIMADFINYNLTCGEIVDLLNEYADRKGYKDKRIYHTYHMTELYDLYADKSTEKLLDDISNIDTSDTFIYYDRHSHIVSANDIEDLPISIEEVAEYIISEEEPLNNQIIADKLRYEISARDGLI